jgi:RNA polymerase sigma factor (sigma-70 family)
MAETDERWERLIRGLRDGDPVVVREFCDQYGALLERVAAKHLGGPLRRRVGPEDIAQSACRTFLRRARAGEFQLADGEGLWRLLCAITLDKVREQARFHRRQKRGLDREVEAATVAGMSSGTGFAATDPLPTPAEAAEFLDQFQRLLESLDEEQRRLVDLKLQGCTNEEAAERLGCSERTTRRLLKRVQARLERTFER